jgi:hypothetical protein
MITIIVIYLLVKLPTFQMKSYRHFLNLVHDYTIENFIFVLFIYLFFYFIIIIIIIIFHLLFHNK